MWYAVPGGLWDGGGSEEADIEVDPLLASVLSLTAGYPLEHDPEERPEFFQSGYAVCA